MKQRRTAARLRCVSLRKIPLSMLALAAFFLLGAVLGGMVAALHDTAQGLSSSYTENGIELDAIVDETLFGRLRQYVTEEV